MSPTFKHNYEVRWLYTKNTFQVKTRETKNNFCALNTRIYIHTSILRGLQEYIPTKLRYTNAENWKNKRTFTYFLLLIFETILIILEAGENYVYFVSEMRAYRYTHICILKNMHCSTNNLSHVKNFN